MIICTLLSGVTYGQSTDLTLVKTVALKADFLEVDNIGNVFAISRGGVSKLDEKGNVLLKNSALVFGNISSMDASNALKMMLFFKDLSQVTYLDNQLASRGDGVALDLMGYSQTTAICRSFNDGMWLFDQTTFELLRLNEQYKITARSGNLSQILDEIPDPNYMREYNNWVYVNDPLQGILVFDWYGSYTKKIRVLGLKKFVIRAGKLFYISENQLYAIDLKTSEMAQMVIPLQDIEDFTLFENTLFLLKQNQLFIYRLNVN